MQSVVDSIESKYKKKQVVDVRSGDTVRVHQKITEGDKTRTQVFEGVVIKTSKKNSLLSRITVRRISSGVGVEKSFLLHSPLIEKIEVTKRSKVRRNNLSYMRKRAGKAARLVGMDFDAEAVNTIEEQQEEAEVVPGEPEEEKEKAETPVESSTKDESSGAAKAKEKPKEDSKDKTELDGESKDEKSEAKEVGKPEVLKKEPEDSKAKPSTEDEASNAAENETDSKESDKK